MCVTYLGKGTGEVFWGIPKTNAEQDWWLTETWSKTDR